MHRRITLLLLLLPLALMLSALLDTPFHKLWTGKLDGVLKSTAAPRVSAEEFWSGKFQANFEAWFEQELAPKAVLVRSDNSMNLVLFRDISGHSGIPIVLGNQHTLFELNYINNLNNVSDVRGDIPPKSHYSVTESARRLGAAARAFRLLGIDFMVVFYPNKAVIWKQRVRPSYLLPGGAEAAAAGYQQLLASLQAQGVPVIDGAAEFTRIAHEDPSFPLFNSGGTHWTDAGACQVARQIVAQMHFSNTGHASLQCGLGKPEAAVGFDVDLASLIDIWDNSRFRDPIPPLTPSLSTPIAGGAKNAWVVGTSFSGMLITELSQAGAFGEVRREWYYRHTGRGSIKWTHELNAHQVVILEQWQWSFLTANVMEFLDDLTANAPRFAKALRRVDKESAGAEQP
ncbi:MAG: hypothetical protein ABI488_19865 [Polyangiaceae bacterium]